MKLSAKVKVRFIVRVKVRIGSTVRIRVSRRPFNQITKTST